MFAIYTKGSVNFRSSSDNLYNLKKVDKVLGVDINLNESQPQSFSVPDKKLYEGGINQRAQDAYKKMANLDTNELIYEVHQIMSKDIYVINENAYIKEVYDIFKEKNIRQIPILNENKKICSMVNQKNILELLMDDLDNVKQNVNKKLKDIYLPDLITADPISDIRRVAKVMVDFNLNAIPIVNQEDELLGIVSRTDILKALAVRPAMQLWG